MFPVKYEKFRGNKWRVVTVAEPLVVGEPIIAVGPLDLPLPTTLEVGEEFMVHAKGDQVRILSGEYVVTGVGAGNDLTLAAGQTVILVASSATTLEIL